MGDTKSTEVAGNAEQEGGAKKITYTATVKALFERILPDVDDSFAKSVDPNAATVLELRLKIRESLEKEKKQEHINDVNDAVVKKLLELNKFPVPQVLVDDEIINLLERRGFIDPKKFNRENFPWEVVRKDLGEAAADRVRAAIIVDRISDQAGIKVAREDIDAAIQEVSHANNISAAEAQRRIFSGDRAVGFMVETSRNKVLEHLRSKAEIKFKD